jgi:hypothetical protein
LSFYFHRLDILDRSINNARGNLVPAALAEDLATSLHDLREEAEKRRSQPGVY